MAWEQLLDLAREARAEQQRDPVACPNDGEPLSQGPDGQLFCRWDGWRPDGSYLGR